MNKFLACIIFFCKLEIAFAAHNAIDENSFSEAEDIADVIIEKPERSIFDLLFNKDDDTDNNIIKYENETADDSLGLIAEVKKDGAFYNNTLIRVLDKTIGVFYDFSLEKGVIKNLKGISVKSLSCWKSKEKGLKPDARALLEINNNEANNHDRIFYGWKLTNFPAMNYIKHPKYELLVIDCN